MNLITGDRFKKFCRYHYTPGGEFLGIKNNNSDLPTVFCETHELNSFMKRHIHYTDDIILVSHNSDGCILPYQFREFDFHFEEHRIPKCIVAWYAQNVDVLSERIRPIPMGLENYKWHRGTKWAEIEGMQKIPIRKEKWLYLNVEVTTNPVERNACVNALRNKGFVTSAHKVPYLQYLTDMQHHRFVACPEGNGWDCHRTWEALYMGCIPVVRKRIFTQMFSRYIPLLLIDNWNNVSLEMLKEFYEKSVIKSRWNTRALEFSFWEKVIRGEIKIQ